MTQEDEYKTASTIAQIFSGCMFTALGLYLVGSNSTRMSYIQKASLEKRLSTICQISVMVAATSAFLNFFQLTEVDNFVLGGSRSMTVDVARPIEWILTCPLMQLKLVLMGGTRIPEYRRTLMPALSAAVLFLGALTLFIDKPYIFIIWAVALGIHSIQMFLNVLQIKEHSAGVETLLSGDSEFRKATIILMLTWLPFPAWYIVSPEGFGIVTNITIIQLGWAFLNVTAKFSLIFYIQRVKDNYCNRLKVKREMKGALNNAYTQESDEEDSCDGGKASLKGELSACVQQTMSDLGMAYNFERFMTLLREAGIVSLDEIAKLTVESCGQLQLPWDLVCALQQRYKVWALEMVDDAERGLEKGERHYKVASLSSPKLLSKKSQMQSDGATPVNNVVPQPMDGIAMPSPKNGSSNEINMGFTDLSPNAGMTPYAQNWMQQAPQWTGHTSNPMQAQQMWSDKNAQQMWSDKNAQQMWNDKGVVPSRRTSFNQPQGGNYAMQQPTIASSDPEAIKEAVKPLEKKLEQLESKMFDKFELAIEKLGERFERQMGQQMAQSPRQNGQTPDSPAFGGSGLKDMRSLVEGQTMLEAKVELILSSQQREQSQQNQQQKEHRQNMEEDMRKHFDALAQKLLLQTTMSQGDGNNNVAARAVEQSLDAVTQKMDEFQDSLKSALSRLGGSITQMMDGWAQHTIQESKAAAFTLQTKMSQLEEAQSKRSAEIEHNITSKMHNLISEGMNGICNDVRMQSKASADQLQGSIDSMKKSNIDEHTKLEQKLMQFVQNLNQEFSKNVELGMGVVGNSLRSQLEGLQASQQTHHHNTESSISHKVDSKLHSMKQELTSQSQQLAAHSQAHTQKQLEKLHTQLTGMVTSTKEDSLVQKKTTDELHSMIRDVRASTEDTVDRMAGLFDHLGFAGDERRGSAGPVPRQASSGPGGRGQFDRQSSSGPDRERPTSSPRGGRR